MRFGVSPAQLLSRDASASPRARDRAKVSRIGLFGFFGIGNFGNDGSLEAMLRLIRNARPAAEVLCICAEPGEVAPKLGVRSVRINWRPKSQLLRSMDRHLLNIPREVASLIQAVRHLSQLDVLIIPGTGILDDFCTGPRGMPYWIFRWCVLARTLGTRVIFVSIGAGPIHHPLSRWLMKSAAKMAVFRSYRDEISKEFMKSIGSDFSNDLIYPDVAFALPQPISLQEPSAEGESITVGVGIMYYTGWHFDTRGGKIYEDYLLKMQRFVGWLLDRGHRVRILMGDGLDWRAVERLYGMIEAKHRVPGSPAVVAERTHSLHDVMAQIANTDVVVASRYHNIVCALKLGRPTLSIGYADKNDKLLTDMGLGDFCEHIDRLDVYVLIQQFRKLVATRKSCEYKIRQANAVFTDRLRHQEALLLGNYL